MGKRQLDQQQQQQQQRRQQLQQQHTTHVILALDIERYTRHRLT